MSDGNETLTKLKRGSGVFKKKIPGVIEGLSKLSQEVYKDGELSKKQKKLIALGMALALRCEPCITRNLKDVKDLGATFEEVMEVCGVAIQMNGGPGFAYSTKVTELWDEI